jgi:hypothetical protein
MSYRIISADCHIDMTWMPGDLWVKNGPAKFRDRVPQVRQTDDGPRWFAEEKVQRKILCENAGKLYGLL